MWHRVPCLLDLYKGYHQVMMNLVDAPKTAFITDHRVYAYKKMSFGGLKILRTTYQRLVDLSLLEEKWKKNVKVYDDDIVVKKHQLVSIFHKISKRH